ncbi:kelch-like protein 24 [Branchiostoma lanceolatum]|uniref:kelch-like protein 24 n=1 Tax=Branchiostoma lanceolatum TaxID=7740 RepID=UPI003455DCDC
MEDDSSSEDSQTKEVSDTVYKGISYDDGDGYPDFFFERLRELRSEGHLLDVTLCAEEKEIPCHRLVLSVFAKYFQAMFSGAHRESKKDKIEIGGVSAEALQQLVDYAYTSNVTITTDNVQSLYEAANMLQFEAVEGICEGFLTRRLSCDTCLATWVLADKVSNTRLSGKARSFALKSFEDVCQTEEFLELPVDFLKTYISDDGLRAKKEERVLEVIMLWTRHNLKERQNDLKVLLECVRFSHVDPDYLKDIMETDKVLAKVPGIEELIKDKFRHAKSHHSNQEEILVLGGFTLSGKKVKVKPNCNMYRLDPHCDCIDSIPLPRRLQDSYGIAACVVDNDVIVTGGCRSEFEAWMYKPYLNSWTELGSLNTGRYDHGMAVVQGQVYVVGGDPCYQEGRSLPDVEVFSKRTNSWNEVAPLPQGACEFGITTCGEKIYVFGGTVGHNEDTADVQCYDPTQNVWASAKPLPKSMIEIRACTVNSKIYLVGGNLPHVLCYDPQEDCYEEMAAPLIPWGKSSATVCGSEIYITGGYKIDPSRPEFLRKVPIATVQCYNVSSDTMMMVNDLPLTLRAHNSVTITKPYIRCLASC